MAPHYEPVAERAQHRYEYCHAPEAPFNFRFEGEHIQPRRIANDSSLENLALACRACNLYKQARQTALDPESMEEVPLFHPRRQSWEEHFFFDSTTLYLLGQTPTGRATVAQLKMNEELAVTARRHWAALELFP